MKITIIGAAGVRTPLIIEAMIRRQERLGLRDLALMDIDEERLEVIGALTARLETNGGGKFNLTRTTDAHQALAGADFVITTFRVGGIESRLIDERVPLQHGILGQETTGPGGFAMGMRTIPVLLGYLETMRSACPHAWLINFANPAGMLAEAAIGAGGWRRTVGICDSPAGIGRVAAAAIGMQQGKLIDPDEVYVDYFGLNHLGWARRITYREQDYLPQLIELIRAMGGMPGLPFDPGFIAALGMIPNEYLYYYYSSKQAVQNILNSGQSRGEQIAALNVALFHELVQLKREGRLEEMNARYYAYLKERGETYMARETGGSHNGGALDPRILQAMSGEGYAGVALDLIEGLIGLHPRQMILNVPNHGAVHGIAEEAVVEIPAFVGRGYVRSLATGEVPGHCLGLMKTVKEYERLTISAAVEGSYAKALLALTLHPLVRDHALAKAILDEYIREHGNLFPALS